MKIAVTGGAGQLGTLVLARLLRSPAVTRVVVVDRRPPAVAGSKLAIVEGDVRDPQVAKHFVGCDAVMHFAFLVTGYATPDEARAVNVEGSRNVFEAAARAGARRIVYSSSIAAYGVVPGHPVPLDETAARVRQPEFTYALSKYDVEDELDAFEREHPDISVARLRPAILIGERMEHMLGWMLRRGLLPDSGEGVPLPIVWDEDVADAAVLALERAAHGAFNLCADDLVPARTLAEEAGMRLLPSSAAARRVAARAIGELARIGAWHGMDPAWLEATSVAMYPTSERAKNELGWSPSCPTAVDVIARYRRDAPHRLDARIALFLQLAGRLGGAPSESESRSRARVRLVLTGPGGGELGVVVEDGRTTVTRAVPRPPTAVVTVRADHFRDLLAGKIDDDALEMTGRATVEGDPSGLRVVSDVARRVRGYGRAKGARGAIAQAMSRWVVS